MTKVIPSLSESGWITSSKDILSSVMSYYILSDAAQSISFQDNIINLPETYFKFINDPEGMTNAIKSDLDKILSRYFVNVDVETKVKELDNKKYAILLYVAVIDDESIKTELSNVAEISSSGLRKILSMNNFGDGLSYLNSI
jgi:hypothetical protein